MSNLECDFYEGSSPPETDAAVNPGAAARPYIGILFDCCGVYVRVYRRPEQDEYTGRCPNCLRPVKVRVAPDGTNSRIFRAR